MGRVVSQKVAPLADFRLHRVPSAAERRAEPPVASRWPPPIPDLLREIRSRAARLPTPVNEYGFDAFGFHREGSEPFAVVAALFYRYWFRVETRGMEHVPARGPVLLVANHGGNFAWDAVMLMTAMLLEAEPPRLARGLAERYLPTLPFLGDVMARTGSVVGTPENCRRLFDRGECVVVFPEGARGAVKPYSKAYQLQRFGLGFMRMALESEVPIVPVGIVGAEESNPGLWDAKFLARLIGAPGFPITPTVPWLGPLGFLLPLPAKFRLTFGPPMRFEGPHDAEDAEIEPRVEAVKTEVARLVGEGLARRRGWFA